MRWRIICVKYYCFIKIQHPSRRLIENLAWYNISATTHYVHFQVMPIFGLIWGATLGLQTTESGTKLLGILMVFSVHILPFEIGVDVW